MKIVLGIIDVLSINDTLMYKYLFYSYVNESHEKGKIIRTEKKEIR